MPRTCVFLLLAFVAAAGAHAGEYRSSHFLERIRNSQEILYSQVVRHYDSLLARNGDPAIHIEKCKFIESALYDAETEENPKQAEWDSCYQELLRRNPDDARVTVYHLNHLYGDSVIVHGNAALDRIAARTMKDPEDPVFAAIHLAIAHAYDHLDSTERALQSCGTALRYDDTLNLHLMMARLMSKLGQKERARTTLLKNEDRMEGWENNQAGSILLENGHAKDAARFYRKNLEDTALYTDYSGLAKALEKSGEIDSARFYHAKALGIAYGKEEAALRQLEFDLRHSQGGMAAASYRTMRDMGLGTDPFSFYRLKLLAMHPLQPVMLRDLAGLVLLFLTLFALALAPYLWVLPMHYLGTRWLARLRPPGETRFTLRHFWICCAAVLITGFLAMGFFQHKELMEGLGMSGSGAPDVATDRENALFLLAYSAMMFAFAVAFMLRTRAGPLFRSQVGPVRSLAYIAGCLALVYAVRRLNLAVFPEDIASIREEMLGGSVIMYIKASLAVLGMGPTLLVVAVMVPLYEEVLFRGVFQDSMGKYLPFWMVNTLQAGVFAALHESLSQFPTFLVMGLAFGWLARKTGGLLVPILAHAANNLIAVSLLWIILEKIGRTG